MVIGSMILLWILCPILWLMFGVIADTLLIRGLEIAPPHWIVRLLLILSGVIGVLFVFIIAAIKNSLKLIRNARIPDKPHRCTKNPSCYECYLRDNPGAWW